MGSGGDADVITVHIKTAEGAHLTLYEVNPHCSVLAIKEKVLVKWTITPSSQTLISPSGAQLHNHEQISECGITNDCELHLIRKGGGVPGPLHDGAPTEHCSQEITPSNSCTSSSCSEHLPPPMKLPGSNTSQEAVARCRNRSSETNWEQCSVGAPS